jgi:hypothetical protein
MTEIAAEAGRQRRKLIFPFLLLEASEIDKQELYEYACQYMRNGKEIDVEVLRNLNEEDRFDVRVAERRTAIPYR